MNAVTDAMIPADWVTLLALAADDRVWTDSTSPGAGVPTGESVAEGVRWCLGGAMWATDGVPVADDASEAGS